MHRTRAIRFQTNIHQNNISQCQVTTLTIITQANTKTQIVLVYKTQQNEHLGIYKQFCNLQ